MGKKNMIPAIPTNNVRFEENGELSFDYLSNGAYSRDLKSFVGGNFTPACLKTKDGFPVSIYLDGAELVIEKYDYSHAARDCETGYIVGGETIEIARFNICRK